MRSKWDMKTAILGLLPLLFNVASAAAGSTLIHNVSGYTWEAGGIRTFDALLISADGRVTATGRLSGLPVPVDARRIDAGGATLLPGFIDAHGHVLTLGRVARQLDLTGLTSLEQTLRVIREYAARNPSSQWIVGRGWNQELWERGEFPTATDLDRAVDDRPVWLTRVDGHAGWANTLAMELAGIEPETVSPIGGSIRRDSTGQPVGIFVDTAQALIARVVPPPTTGEDREALRLAVRQLSALGVTGVHDAGISTRTVGLYQELADAGELSVRIYGMLTAESLADFDRPLIDYADGRLTVRSVKLYADGALGSRGAALLEPYQDEPDNLGLLIHGERYLARRAKEAAAKGFQVSIHAIGDLGNRVALDALERAQRGADSTYRNRIEHAQVVSVDDIPRFRSLGVIASMQPTHATSDMAMAEKRLSLEQLEGAYAWRRFLDAGVVIAAGSDFPVEPANPLYGLHAAVARENRRAEPSGGWRRDQALTVAEALRAFTLDAAYAAMMDDRAGSLEPGKWADFVLLDRDIFALPDSEIWHARVLETWLAGERVH